MLNRRRQLAQADAGDQVDDNNCDERQQLLTSYSQTSLRQTQPHGLVANNQPFVSRPIATVAHEAPNLAPIPILRKTHLRDRLSEQKGQPFDPHRHQVDSHELTRFREGGNSGAVINIPSGQHARQHQPLEFIYYTIQPGDSLQNLSVKYSCPVASIKRLNNLWTDQEFYALSRIKLPVGRLRLIADVIEEEDNSKTLSEQSPQITDTSLFQNLDLSIEKARTAAKSYDDNASAIMQQLVQSGNKVDTDDDIAAAEGVRQAEILLNDLSDYGLSYNFLILFIFIVCLVCPLAYVIYLEETHHDPNKAL